MRVFLLDASVWDPVAGALRAVQITDAALKTVWGGALYEQLLVRPPSIRVEVPWDGDFSGGSRTSVDEIEILMPSDFDWLARLDWVEATIRLRSAEDGAADAALADYGAFTVARMSADERALRLILKDWQAELTKPFLGQYDGTGGLNGEPADKGSYIPAGWGRVLLAPAQFIDRANLVMRFDRGPVAQVDAVRQRGILIPIAADLPDLAALNAAVIPPGKCVTCRALGLVRFRFTPGEPVTIDYRGSTRGGYVERLPEIVTRVAAEAGLSVDAASVSALSAAIPQPGGLIASGPMTPAQAFDLLLAGVRGAWAIRWDGALVLGRIDFSNPVDLDADILSVEVSKGSAPSWEHTLGYARNWRPLADGELAEGITSADIVGLGALATQSTVDYATQVGGAEKPENNATVGAPAGTLVGGIPSEHVHLGTSAERLYDDFSTYATATEVVPAVWLNRQGGGELAIYNSAISTGGRALRVGSNGGNDESWLVARRDLPFDPAALYRVSARIYQESGVGRVYVGVEGRALDGGLVNSIGEDSYGGQHYVAASDAAPPVGQYITYTGWIRGFGAVFPAPDSGNPSGLHPNVRRIAPLVLVNYSQQAGVCYIDYISLERFDALPWSKVVGADALVSQAQSAATNSQTALDAIASYSADGILSPLEKAVLITTMAQIDQEYVRLDAQAAVSGATVSTSAQRAAFQNAYTALKAYLGSLSPAWNNRALDTLIVRSTYDGRFGDYRFAVQNLANLIAYDATQRATWSSVTGTGRPEDGATNDRGEDTRNDDFSPTYYRQNWLRRYRTEFKNRSTVGAPGSVAHGITLTYAAWQDDSGGPVVQEFRSENGVYVRRGTSSGWGTWATSFDEVNVPNWNNHVSGRPAELTDGTVVDTRNRASRLRTNGRAQGNLLPTGNNSGVTSGLTTTPISGLTSTSVTIAPHTRYILGRAVTYNGGTISGLNPSTRYHIYADDPDELGGSVGYLATTDFSIISGENRIYFGPVTTAAVGNPGGGGGGGGGDLPPDEFCVDVAMFVGPDKRVGSVEPGDLLWCMDDAGTPQGLRPVCSAAADLALCQCLEAENGASVVVSWSAPLWTLNRGIIRAVQAAPGDVVMTRVCNADLLSPLAGVEKLGWRAVRKIHIQGISYAAGTTPDAMIYTHNPTYKP